MKILLDRQRRQLVENHETIDDPTRPMPMPVVKLFVCVGGSATWLLTELDPETNVAFGLCDLGLGFPELGYVSLTELEDTLGWRLERDRHWTPTKTLTEYADEARSKGMIVA
tara:strand:+ start:296 stop:631 length:336 start_codon:yes stop_codon:yes gene_type:complete